jgi:inhibitor of cysteine peptidase
MQPSRSLRLASLAFVGAALASQLVVLAGCGGRPGPRMAVARVTHRLVSGTKHESSVPVGGELSTELPFSAGTGYAWVAKDFDAGVLSLVSQESKSESTDGKVGGPMVEHFVFKGLATGETTIEFELRRPWEKDAAPAEKRSMRVKVTAAK